MADRREQLTDPYGNLEYVIGSGDDFWCFDFHVHDERREVRLHAVINSESGSFIQDAEPPGWASYADAVNEAIRLVFAALDWCADNNVRHSVKGWNQDPMYFARAVAQAIVATYGDDYQYGRGRVARKSGKTPDGNAHRRLTTGQRKGDQ